MIGSGGVVYAGGSGITESRYGQPITIASGALIPPGSFLSTAAWQVNVGGAQRAMPAGVCFSDGFNATTTAAGVLLPVGAKPAPVWPWPKPWPLT